MLDASSEVMILRSPDSKAMSLMSGTVHNGMTKMSTIALVHGRRHRPTSHGWPPGQARWLAHDVDHRLLAISYLGSNSMAHMASVGYLSAVGTTRRSTKVTTRSVQASRPAVLCASA